MRTTFFVFVAVVFFGFISVRAPQAETTEFAPIPVLTGGPDSVTGIVVSIGIGAVVGVVVANATLPAAWGLATSLVGAVGGGMLGHWVHVEATRAPLLHRPASAAPEPPPSLFHMATASKTGAEYWY